MPVHLEFDSVTRRGTIASPGDTRHISCGCHSSIEVNEHVIPGVHATVASVKLTNLLVSAGVVRLTAWNVPHITGDWGGVGVEPYMPWVRGSASACVPHPAIETVFHLIVFVDSDRMHITSWITVVGPATKATHMAVALIDVCVRTISSSADNAILNIIEAGDEI